MMFIPTNFSNVIVQGSAVFDKLSIMAVRLNMEVGYIKPSKIQTFSPNSSKESLKWSKESNSCHYLKHYFSAIIKFRGPKNWTEAATWL